MDFYVLLKQRTGPNLRDCQTCVTVSTNFCISVSRNIAPKAQPNSPRFLKSDLQALKGTIFAMSRLTNFPFGCRRLISLSNYWNSWRLLRSDLNPTEYPFKYLVWLKRGGMPLKQSFWSHSIRYCQILVNFLNECSMPYETLRSGHQEIGHMEADAIT